MDLKNKVVLITGASRGIGQSTAIAFAKNGCSAIINYKSDLKAAQEVLKECNRYSKNNMIIQADVSEEKAVLEMITKIKNTYPQLDILVNNAGIFDEGDSPTNLRAFDNIYKNNFLSVVIVTKYSLELMSEGKIINISSIHGRLGQGNPQAIAYSAFKAALDSYTKNLARALAPKILINAIAPGRVVTQLWGDPDADKQKVFGRAHLIKRMIQPEEVADAIIFLAQNDAVCGEVLTIDGGMSLTPRD